MGRSVARGAVAAVVLLSTTLTLAPRASADTSPRPEGAPPPTAPDVLAKSMAATVDYDKRAHALGDLIRGSGTLGVYNNSDDSLVVVVPSSGSSTFRAADAEALGFQVTVETLDAEPSEIADIKALVAKVDWIAAPGTAQPVGMFDARLGKVRILSDAPPELFQSIVDQYPDLVVATGQGVSFASICTDWEGTRGHFGGAALVEPAHGSGAHCGGGTTNPLYTCSSGFGAWNNANPSRTRMITAAHCYADGASIWSPGGDWFGFVKYRPNWYGGGYGQWPNPGNVTDFEAIGDASVRQGHYVYNGATGGDQAYLAVESGGDPDICTCSYDAVGATTYHHDGLHFDQYVDFPFTNTSNGAQSTFRWFHLVSSPTNAVCPGDSGGVVYKKTQAGNAQVMGIINGQGSGFVGVLCGTQTMDVYGSNLSGITSVLGVTLLTISNDP